MLDEAHLIRKRNTQTGTAACEIKADVRWCLTGTPLVNKVEDAEGIVRFLRIEPFNDHKWWHRTVIRPMRIGDGSCFKTLAALFRGFYLRTPARRRPAHAHPPEGDAILLGGKRGSGGEESAEGAGCPAGGEVHLQPAHALASKRDAACTPLWSANASSGMARGLGGGDLMRSPL